MKQLLRFFHTTMFVFKLSKSVISTFNNYRQKKTGGNQVCFVMLRNRIALGRRRTEGVQEAGPGHWQVNLVMQIVFIKPVTWLNVKLTRIFLFDTSYPINNSAKNLNFDF